MACGDGYDLGYLVCPLPRWYGLVVLGVSLAGGKPLGCQPKAPIDGGPVKGDAKLVVKDNVVEGAIPWSELPDGC